SRWHNCRHFKKLIALNPEKSTPVVRCRVSRRRGLNGPRTLMSNGNEKLPPYRVRARNTSADSENKIHDDTVAASYGFRGGLVPGVTVYGYMTVPIVARFGHDWLERGSMQVKFHQPFYEGEEVTVLCEVDTDSEPLKITVIAQRADGTACATGLATV